MSTLDLSSCVPSSVVTSSAPLPISMHISSPEQHTVHLPGHLSLSVTGVDSDTLDSQAKGAPSCNLANKLPYRLFNIA